MKLALIYIFFSHVAILVNGANILIMLPFPAYSHTNSYMPLFDQLAARGHNITAVTPFPKKEPPANWHDIVFPNIWNDMLEVVPQQDFVKSHYNSYKFFFYGFWMYGLEWSKLLLNHDIMKQLMHDTNSKFDLIIIETWFVQEPLVAFGHKFKAPVINIASRPLLPGDTYYTGNNLPTSYVPYLYSPHSDRMNYLERIRNCFSYYLEVIGNELYYIRQQDAIMREHFKYPGSENLPPLSDMLKNTSLTLIDHSFTLGYPAPYLKNVVEFGAKINKRVEKLPEDLQKYMDSAEHGIIFFSLGSYITLSAIKPQKQLAIISALGKLKQKVLMKIEPSNQFINMTKSNILVREWLPQQAILAHPNCKLFITHAGLGSTKETIYYGVPVVTIPLISDQIYNAVFMETSGFGYNIFLDKLTEEELLSGINTVLSDPSYLDKVRERSAIFKDTPMDTVDHAAYWVEYVIRHGGAPHLRPAVLDLHWYQQFMLDVIAVYTLIMIIVMYILYIIIRSIYRSLIFLIFGPRKNIVKAKMQ